MSRPEHVAPADIFYNEDMAQQYAQSSRMINIQTEMSERAMQLMMLPNLEEAPASGLPGVILDIGCGSGISGGMVGEWGHMFVGCDISQAMLDVALEREVTESGDFLLQDMGHGLPFRAGAFDGALSISALQWLCNEDQRGHEPFRRLRVFFQGLFNCLKKGARAVFQFYPESAKQVEMITAASARAGFGGGLVVDYPHSTKAKKYFLVLYAGFTAALPQAMDTDMAAADAAGAFDDEDDQANVKSSTRQQQLGGKKSRRGQKPSKREYIRQKKERQKLQGRKVRHDSKYTGRKRKPKF